MISDIFLDKEMTAHEFFAFCHLPEMRDKRIERTQTGEIVIQELVGAETSILNGEISAEVSLWNRRTKGGFGFGSSTGFTLPNTSVKSPDVSWITRTRWAALPKALREIFAPITPDFVIEIRSKTDSLKELKEKMEEYMENGCRLGWLIDRIKEHTYIYRADGSREVVDSFGKTLTGEDVLVGFTLRIADLEWD